MSFPRYYPAVLIVPVMIRIEVLGDPVIRRADGPVTGRAAYRRRVALLAILAAARGRPVGRERLIGLLWPEQPADAARHGLSEALYVLRRELGEETFVSHGDEVGLNASHAASDLDDFERELEAGRDEAAVRVYRGPFLDGFYVSDAPEFERWVDGERDRLARLRARALERLAAAAEGAGEWLSAAEWWRLLAADDPFSSRLALRLVRALHAAGEHAAALRHAAAHAALLREELGVAPDAELTDFVERVRADTAPRPARAAPREPEAPSASPPGAAAPSSPDPAAAPPVSSPAPSPSTGSLSTASARGDDGAALSSSSAVAGAGVVVLWSPSPDDAVQGRPGSAGAVVPWALAPAPAGGEVARSAAGRLRRRVVVYGAAVLVLAGALALAVSGARRQPPRQAPPRYDPRRIAVLYFDDDSPDGRMGYLARGLTEMLIHELSQVQALDVVSRNGVKPYRDGSVPLDSVAARLRVGSLVEGSVQDGGDSVRVTVQLVDANAQSHLLSRVIVRPKANVLALESAVAEEVSGFLRRRLGEEVRLRQTAEETASPEARDLVLRAEAARSEALEVGGERHPIDQRSAMELLAAADSLLRQAEAADPGWARPTVLRGEVALSLSVRSPGVRQVELRAAAIGFADQVLERDPRNAPALMLRGVALWHSVVETRDTAGQGARLARAERDLRAAVDADSSLAPAWDVLSQVLRLRGAFAESDLAARRALEQDAYLDDAGDILERLFYGAMAQGDYAEARRTCGQGGRQLPADRRFVQCRLTLLREDPSQPADPALAWRLAAELDRLDPPARARAAGRGYDPIFRRVSVAAVLARAGAADSARAVLARARRDAAGNAELEDPLREDEAAVRILLGERAEARRLLGAYLRAHPTFAPALRRDALFGPLLADSVGAAP